MVIPHTGSRSNPLAPLPSEIVYGATVALGFGTIAFAFALALAGFTSLRSAAALSIFYHAAFGIHIATRWSTWSAFVHSDAPTVNHNFFLVTHVAFTLLSAVLVLFPRKDTRERRKNT
jgi:hypothetical protein